MCQVNISPAKSHTSVNVTSTSSNNNHVFYVFSKGADVQFEVGRLYNMARNFEHARAVNIQTCENLQQYGYTKL